MQRIMRGSPRWRARRQLGRRKVLIGGMLALLALSSIMFPILHSGSIIAMVKFRER